MNPVASSHQQDPYTQLPGMQLLPLMHYWKDRHVQNDFSISTSLLLSSRIVKLLLLCAIKHFAFVLQSNPVADNQKGQVQADTAQNERGNVR